MDRRLARGWQRLITGKERLLERLGRRDAAEREWRSGGEGWSLADVVEHLVLVERGMLSALAKPPSADRPREVRPGRPLRWVILRFVMMSGIRIRAPVDAVLPTRQLPWPDLLARWGEERTLFQRWLEGSDPAIHPTPRFRHPIVGWLDVPQAVTFAADHFDHHLRQVGRIEAALRGRGG